MLAASADTLTRFEFNEGTGYTTTNTTATLVGNLGLVADPADNPVVNLDSPAGIVSDHSLTLADPDGYLLLDLGATNALNAVDQPLTAEAWIYIPADSAPRGEGITGYGGSWKLGIRPDGQLAFTLFGIIDADSGYYPPTGVWTHVAAVVEPGVGITYYGDGVSVGFVAVTDNVRAANYTSIGLGSAGFGEPFAGTVDRIRVHRALLADTDLDSVAATPKAPLSSTVISFGFNEAGPTYPNAGSASGTAKPAQDILLASQAPAWVTNTPSKKAGDFALSFNGSQHITVNDPNQVLDFPSGDFTIQAWVNYTTLPAGQLRSVLFGSAGPGGAMSFSVTADHHVFVTTFGILDIPTQAAIPNDGLWHHIAVIHRNGLDLRFYVDGLLGDTISYTRGIIYTRTDTTFVIGAEPGFYNPYKGLLDRLQISNGAIDPKDLDYLAVPGVVPGAPDLTIGTAVSVSWGTGATGFTLQSSTNLVEPKVWTDVSVPPIVIGTNYYTLLPTTDVKTFFRLYRPTSP
jgi:hypothetical protein